MKTLQQTVPIPSDLPVYLKLAMVTMIWGGTFVAGRILADVYFPVQQTPCAFEGKGDLIQKADKSGYAV